MRAFVASAIAAVYPERCNVMNRFRRLFLRFGARSACLRQSRRIALRFRERPSAGCKDEPRPTAVRLIRSFVANQPMGSRSVK